MLNRFYAKFHVTNNLKFKDGKFILIDFPIAIFPVSFFKEIALIDHDEFHLEVYKSMKKSSTELAERFKKEHGFNSKQIRSFLFDFLTNSGFGEINIIRNDEKKTLFEISIKHNPFAEEIRFKSKKPVDHMLRGMIAGILTAGTGEKIDCVETNCVAVNKPYCSFIAKKQKDFNYDNELVKAQLGK